MPATLRAELSEQERVAHVLSRLTFGARAGDAERVTAMGVSRWIERQLEPGTISDGAVDLALAPLPAWSDSPSSLGLIPAVPASISTMTTAAILKDTAARAVLNQIGLRLAGLRLITDQFYAGKIIRAEVSERQLQEVVADFWENHFSVFSGKMPTRETIVMWDRDAIRPHALGKFRDLLGAVAHSPAMLFYLDNHLSTSRGLNENYARELLELHTLGADGGYTQRDVMEVARALTGWSIDQTKVVRFEFRRAAHDTGVKQVLGRVLRGGRGIEDGEEVLDIIARHPSTARYISLKLARRFVSDEPPAALVARAAATFQRTDGDIAQVVRTIVTSPEFFSRAAYRAKVKTPFELVVSIRRAFDAVPDTTTATSRLIAQLGQPLFGWPTPDGYPEKGGAWINSGTIRKRLKIASDIADGAASMVTPIQRWHEWSTLSTLPLDRQVDGVINSVLAGCAEAATREAMLANERATSDSLSSSFRLRDLLAIALSSPEFQRR